MVEMFPQPDLGASVFGGYAMTSFLPCPLEGEGQDGGCAATPHRSPVQKNYCAIPPTLALPHVGGRGM